MSDKKISQLTAATTPLAGSEVLPIVQGGNTVKVSVDNLTTGKNVPAAKFGAGVTPVTVFDAAAGTGAELNLRFSPSGWNTLHRVGVQYTGNGSVWSNNALMTSATTGNLDDVANSGSAILLETSGSLKYVTASAGANPRTFTQRFNVNASGDFTVDTGNLVIGTSGKGITTSGATTLGFGTNGSTTQAVLETGGTLTVGRSSAIVAANSGSLQVYGDLNQVVIGNTVAGAGQSFNLSMSGVGTFFVTNDAGAGVYLTYGATSWTSTSDINKKNITGQIENALDKVNTLTAARFIWKNDASKTPQVGLIAQEVLEVLPEVVADNGEGVLGVRYTEVIPLLVAAIKELSARVDALEGQ